MANPISPNPTEQGVSPEEKRAAFHSHLEKKGYDKAKINQMESSYKEVSQELNPSVNLGLVGEEYKVPDKEIEGSVLEDLGSSFYNAFVDLGEGLGNLIPMVSQAVGADNKDGTFWDTWTNGVTSWADNREVRLSDKGSQALSDDFSNLNAWGSAFGQGLGFIASMFGGGMGAAKIASGLGKSAQAINKAQKTGQFLSGTLSMTPGIYEEAKNAGLSKANAARMALGISSVVSMTEGIALEWMGKTIAKPVTNKAAKEAMKESLAKFSVKDMTRADFDDAIALTGMKFGDKMKSHGAKAFASTAIESTQEFTQTYIEEGMKELYDTIFASDKKKGEGAFGADVMTWETFREALAGGLVGGMVGGALGTAGSLREGIKGETLFYEVNNAVKKNDKAKIDTLKNTIANLNAQGKLADTPENIFAHIDSIVEYSEKTKGLNIPNTAARYQLFQMMDLEKIASDKFKNKFATDETTHKLVSSAYNRAEKLAGMVSTALNDDMKKIIDDGKTLEKNPEKFESQMQKYADLYKMISLGVVKDEEVLNKLLPKVSYSVKEKVAEQKKAEKAKAEANATATTSTATATATGQQAAVATPTTPEIHYGEVNGVEMQYQLDEQGEIINVKEKDGSRLDRTVGDTINEQLKEQHLEKIKLQGLAKAPVINAPELIQKIEEAPDTIKLSEIEGKQVTRNGKTGKIVSQSFDFENELNELDSKYKEKEKEIEVATKEEVYQAKRTNTKPNFLSKNLTKLHDELRELNYKIKNTKRNSKDKKYYFESNGKQEELGNEDVIASEKGIKLAKQREFKKKESTEPDYNVTVSDENTAEIDGEKYQIQTDDKGNIISLKNDKRTIRQEKALVKAEVQRNRLDSKKDHIENEEELHDELVKTQTTSYDEINAIDNLLSQNMTDKISDLLDNGVTDNTEQSTFLQAELYLENAIKVLEGSHADSEYAQALIESLKETQKIIDNEYDKHFKETVPEITEESGVEKVKEQIAKQSDEKTEEERGRGVVEETEEEVDEEQDDDFTDEDEENEKPSETKPDNTIPGKDVKEQRSVNTVSSANSIQANQALFNKIKAHFAKIFPHIPVAEIDRIAWQYGPEVLARVTELGIEINKDSAMQSSLIHEYAHVYLRVLGMNDPIVKMGLEMIKSTPFMEWAKTNYPHLSTAEQAEEALVEAIAQSSLDALKTRFEGTQLDKFMAWAKKFWNRIKRLFRQDKAEDIVSIIADGMTYRKMPVAKNNTLLAGLNADHKNVIDPKTVGAVRLINNAMIALGLDAVINKYGQTDITKKGFSDATYSALVKRYLAEKANTVNDKSLRLFNGIDNNEIKTAFEEENFTKANELFKNELQQKNPEMFKVVETSIQSIANKNKSTKNNNQKEDDEEGTTEAKSKNVVKAIKGPSKSIRSVIGSILDSSGELTNTNKIFQYITSISNDSMSPDAFINQLMMDGSTGSNPEASALYNVLSGMTEATRLGVLTELNSLVATPYWSTNITTSPGKVNEETGESTPIINVRDRPVNQDAIIEDDLKQAIRRVDSSDNEQAIALLSELLNDDEELEKTLLTTPSENTYNRIKQILDIVLEQNLDINVVKKLVDDLNKKGNDKLRYWLDSPRYPSLLGILRPETRSNKGFSLKDYSQFMKNLMIDSKGRKEVQTNFVNKAGNRVSAIKPGDWISQFRKLLINGTKYIKNLMSNNTYANNPVLKFWKDNNNVDYYIHDAISNAVKSKVNGYSEQSVSDTNILGLQRFVNNVSPKFYYQNIGVTADRDHSTWFKVPRIANADLKQACIDRAKIEQELYDKKVKANPSKRAEIDNFFNKLSINKIVDGKVIPYGDVKYPENFQKEINKKKSELLKNLNKFDVDKSITENNKEYKTTDDLLEAFVVNDGINRQWLMDVFVGPGINLKDVPDVMKRLGGSNSGVKQFPLDKPVHVFVINSTDKSGKINSDSFSFNGSNLHNELARLSGPTDKVGANMKDQLYQVNPDGQLNYFKMSTIGDYGNALRNMGPGYIEMSDALRAIEEQLGGDAYVKIIDKKAIKGPMEGYNIIELNDFVSASKSDIKGLVAKGHSMEFNNYGVAFNLNKDLSKVPLNEQVSILSTQTAKIILNGATTEELNQFESSIVGMLKGALGIKGDDYSKSKTFQNLLDPKLLSIALTKNIDEEDKNLISKILFAVNEVNKNSPNNPIRSFDHPNLVNAVQQFLSTKLTKTGIKVEIAGNYLQMVPNYGSGLEWYKHDANYNLTKRAEIALPWSMFAKSKEQAEAMLKSNPDAFRVVVVRVPASAPVSEFVATVKYFTDGNTNSAVLPDQFMHTSDADHDGDKTFVYRQELDADGNVMKDSNKTKIFNMMDKRMSSADQVKETMTNDLGLETLKENLRRLGFNNVDSFNLSDFQGVANIQDTMSFGADAIGIMAIASKMLSVLSQSKEQLKQPLSFGYNNDTKQLTNQDELQAFTDKSINNIAKLLQAALDLAKDPLLSNTGINKHTVNVATTLVLLGRNIEEISGFLNNPAIKTLVKLLDSEQSSFNPNKAKSVFEIVKDYKSQVDTVKIPKRIKDYNKFLEFEQQGYFFPGNEVDKTKTFEIADDFGQPVYYKINPVEIEGKKDAYKISRVDESVTEEMMIMRKFSEIQSISGDISTLIPIIQLDKQLPNNATELKRLIETIKEVEQNNLSLTTSKFMERPLIKHYIQVSKLLENLIKRKFVTEKQEMHDMASELTGTFTGLDTKKAMDETLYQYVSQEFMKGDEKNPAKMIDELINLVGNLNTENTTVEIEAFDKDKNKMFNDAMQTVLTHESIEEKDKALDNMVEAYGQNAIDQYMMAVDNKAKYEHLKDNKFLQYVTLSETDGVVKITPKREAFQFESDGVKDEIRKSFEDLPQDLQNMLINYQLLRDGINDKIGSLMEMLPQHYSMDLLKSMSNILNSSKEYFDQNKDLLKKNAVLKFKNKLKDKTNLKKDWAVTIDKDGNAVLGKNDKSIPYAFVKDGKVYVSENGKYVPLENEHYQSGKGWVKMSKDKALVLTSPVIAPVKKESITGEVQQISPEYGVVQAETNPSKEKTQEYVDLIAPQIQVQTYKENKGKFANEMFHYGLMWARVNTKAKPIQINSFEKAGYYAYHEKDQNGNELPPISELQPIINEISKILEIDMSNYDSVIGNIYLPGQYVYPHKDTTESVSARKYPVIVYTIGNNAGLGIVDDNKGKMTFANKFDTQYLPNSDKLKGYTNELLTQNGSIYTFGLNGKGRFELTHSTPINSEKIKSYPPLTLPNGQVITNYTITLTFRRASDLRVNTPESPEVVETKSESTTPEYDKLPGKSEVPTMTYAGIGSRETPVEIQNQMTELAKELESRGFKLNTGDAVGADSAFGKGTQNKEVFTSKGDATDQTRRIAREIHPNPNAIDNSKNPYYIWGLHARNTNQIFGKDLNTPVDFVVVWTKDGGFTGGSGQAMRYADGKNIPIINLYNPNWRQELDKVLIKQSVTEQQPKQPQPITEPVVEKQLESIVAEPESPLSKPKDHSMVYKMPASENLTGKDTTTIELIEQGLRTATTRSYPLGKIGDIITFNGRPQQYKITQLEQLTPDKFENEEWLNEWSRKEQWTVEHFDKVFGGPTVHEGSWQTTFEKIGITESKLEQRKTYSGLIETLNENQVFVFGSNPLGVNGNIKTGTGGSALVATKNGWVNQGEKMINKLSDSGKSWGIVTVRGPGQVRSIKPNEIQNNISKLYEYAKQNPDKEFMIAYKAGGRNLNGYSDQEMADMFSVNSIPDNIVFEDNFSKLLTAPKKSELKTETKKEESVSDKPKFVPKNAEQSKAIELMQNFITSGDSNKWFTLEGKAGTGKTTLVQEVLSKFPNKKIIISAIAHKAKKVLYNKISEYADNLKVSPQSVAAMLGMKMDMETGKFELPNKDSLTEKPIDNADIIIVDEASMLNEQAIQLIMENKQPDAKVIFLGDPGQLPPIREISSDKISPVFNTENKYGLRERVRQGEESPILPFADNFWTDTEQMSTTKNSLKTQLSDKGNLVFVNDILKIKDFIVNQFKQAVAEKNPNKIKIVAYRNETRRKTNKFIRDQIFNNPTEQFLPGEILMFNNQFKTKDSNGRGITIENAEEIVIETSTNSTEKIKGIELQTKIIEFYNEDGKYIHIEVVKEESKADLDKIIENMFNTAKIETNPKLRKQLFAKAFDFKNTRFADLDYAYAITSHKSQGSTYETVLVNAEDIVGVTKISTITKARSIYTAITRASKTAIFFSGKLTDVATTEQINELNNTPDNNDDINEVKESCF